MGINGSLTALGKVIRALGERASHVPFRDSVLTKLLRSSLEGKATTAVVSRGHVTSPSVAALPNPRADTSTTPRPHDRPTTYL